MPKSKASTDQLAFSWGSPAPIKLTQAPSPRPMPFALLEPMVTAVLDAPGEPASPIISARLTMTPSDAIATFLGRITLKGFSGHTIRAYDAILNRAAAAIGHCLLEATPDELDRYVSKIAASGVKGATVRKHQNTLRSFYRDAIKRELITRDPTRRFESPKVEERVPIHLSVEQMTALLDSLGTETRRRTRELVIIKALYYSGMRSCELIALDWEAIDWAGRQFIVFGKGKKERRLPICEPLEVALRAWLEAHPLGRGPILVTLDPRHSRLCYDAMARVVRAAIARAGLSGKRFSAHKLRSTFATRLVNEGVPIEQIQKLLGHKQITTTMIYAHAELQRGIGDTLSRIL